MLTLTRELIAGQLMEIPPLVDAYASHDSDFTERVVAWFVDAEAGLGRLRHPKTSYVAIQRGRILASQDGAVDEAVAPTRSRFKARRATAIAALGATEAVLSQAVAELDVRVHDLSERVAQLVAVLSVAGGLPSPAGLGRDQWIAATWTALEALPDGRPVVAYLRSVASHGDLLAVLGDVLDNWSSNQDPSHQA